MGANEQRHVVGMSDDPISLIESAHAWVINLAGSRRVTIVRPDGVAIEVWPAAPMILGRVKSVREAAREIPRTPQRDGGMVLIACALFALSGLATGFLAGVFLF